MDISRPLHTFADKETKLKVTEMASHRNIHKTILTGDKKSLRTIWSLNKLIKAIMKFRCH